MLANRTMGGGLPAPSFWLELLDAGAGAVNTTPSLANGSPTATFTRATTAWTKLSTGLWASVASGIARSCYIGQTTAVGAYGGYFSELAATQLVTPTASIRDMSDASWVKTTMTAAKTATGIDGVVNSASTITATGATATILQTLAAAATSRTYSCWVKRRTGTGTVLLKQGTATLDITALINSSTYTLVQLNDNELNVAFGLQINTNGDAVDVDFNQFESGAFATSPLDTTGAVRNADVLTYATAGNFDNTVGASYCEPTPNSFAVTSFVPIGTSSANRTLAYFSTTTLAYFDGTNNPTVASGLSAGATAKIGTNWGGVVAGGFANGTKLLSGTFDSNWDFTNISIGMNSTFALFGTVKNVRLWLRQLADNQLVSLTS